MQRLLSEYVSGPDKITSNDYALPLFHCQWIADFHAVESKMDSEAKLAAFWCMLLSKFEKALVESDAVDLTATWQEVKDWVSADCNDVYMFN